MSKKEIKNTEQKPEKVMTRYDLKVQKREAQKKQEQKDALKSKILGIALVVALAALVASFPIRNYLTINSAYIVVDGEEISRVEFEYNYNVAKTNYLSTYGTYLYYMGMDISQDFDDEMYTDLRTWGDYFDELAVENIKQYKSLAKEGKAAGFEYDCTEEYNEYLEALEANAKEAGQSAKAFTQGLYGELATEARVKPFVEEAMYASAYYNHIYDGNIPAEDEVLNHYELNANDYDSVDYYIAYVDAVLPTEATDSSATESTADASASTDATGTDTATDTTTVEDAATAYEPTEEEIAAAMATAKAEIDEKAEDIRTNGTLATNVKQSEAVYILRDWLFEEGRKEGDATTIEDSVNSRYYAVEFVSRYLNETHAADVRIVFAADGNVDAIYEEWKNGDATEESFAAICDKYNDVTLGVSAGGLYEGLSSSGLSGELKEWIFSADRVAGETAVIKPEDDEYNYVVYYVAPNRLEYVIEIENEIASERTVEYVNALVESVVVEDPKDNLKYPERIEVEELLSTESETTDGTETESSAADSSAQ